MGKTYIVYQVLKFGHRIGTFDTYIWGSIGTEAIKKSLLEEHKDLCGNSVVIVNTVLLDE